MMRRPSYCVHGYGILFSFCCLPVVFLLLRTQVLCSHHRRRCLCVCLRNCMTFHLHLVNCVIPFTRIWYPFVAEIAWYFTCNWYHVLCVHIPSHAPIRFTSAQSSNLPFRCDAGTEWREDNEAAAGRCWPGLDLAFGPVYPRCSSWV